VLCAVGLSDETISSKLFHRGPVERPHNGAAVIRLDDLLRVPHEDALFACDSQAPLPAFLRLVKDCGAIAVDTRREKWNAPSLMDAFCAALRDFILLSQSLRISSLGRVIFQKYPGFCPYCRMSPHEDSRCKTARSVHFRGDGPTTGSYQSHGCQPESLQEWQNMFQRIYPRRITDLHLNRSVLGLFEELGELAEAIIQADRSAIEEELADTFSYLMGLANELTAQTSAVTNGAFSFEDEFLLRYRGEHNNS
jgi:NTP pyrophosphatase (non-canonical NTP hydrolase)